MGKRSAILLSFLLPAVSTAARACTVCFGDPSSDLSRGLYWGVVLLLLLPFCLLTGLIGLVAYHIRRNRALAAAPPAGETA